MRIDEPQQQGNEGIMMFVGGPMKDSDSLGVRYGYPSIYVCVDDMTCVQIDHLDLFSKSLTNMDFQHVVNTGFLKD